MSDPVDTGFDAVLAGEKWEAPQQEEPAPPSDGAIYAAVSAARTPPEQQAAIEEIITAAVTEGLTEEGKQAAKALVHLPHLTPVELAKLAREIAMDVKEHHVVLKDFNLTETQYEYLSANNEFYVAALRAACIEWHAPLSTQERIRVEAAAILEDTLPGLGARMQNKSEGLPGVIEAAKLFAKMASVGEREASSANSGERFTINIDLGGGQKITASAEPHPQIDDQANKPSALPTGLKLPGES